ncbi:MAG: RND transporter [Alteromonadaceae bacterium]|uniref:efflux RND transporter permease subunit n=1 Tax=unclassified Marinobacter TaxID=83889 RepID=UPI000C6B6AB2|nr:MMPL family transporter [Marinobacter sp. BGYM27]MAA64277.1 RND transporter [Alteromonadaceae bacterium]MBH84302.1 RND transporter [Alteromonadaceae bacterium]MDG5498506.1 MMPL family transporter [Marinobacter sp. BGYM27]|tara:strand:+ start:28830 stop:31217 length:2388 start_codon:yes stop_codon:yes gene_type:complete
MSNPKHDKGEHYFTSPKAEPFLERLIFNNRAVILILFLLLTVFLGYNAVKIEPDASFERMIPLEHPYIINMLDHREDLENLGNFVRIAVEVEDGDIFTDEYMQTLKEITDEVFFLNGVDRSGLKSVWTPNVRWVEVTEQGFQGGSVIPDDYDGSRASLEQLRQNILRSNEVGRLVSDNFKSTIVYAPLYENNPETGAPLDYQAFSKLLEQKVREKYQDENPNIKIHIVGFAKKVGDLIEGIGSIAWFAGITIILTTLLLFWYSRCIAGTLVPVLSSIVAVFWQLGILRLLGYGLDPYSVLVPFLVFAIGISHGVQVVNAMASEAAKGFDPMTSARLAFRSLYIPGMLALVSDAFGFLTLLFIEIDVIRDLAVAAGVGVAIIIITNLVLHPLIMSYVGITKGGVKHVQNRGEKQDRKWRIMSYFAHPGVAPISLLIALLGLGLGLYYKQDLKVGDLDQGAPELRADSRYNLDNKYIIENYSTSADVLVVMVETQKEQCTQYEVLNAMDRLQWELQNTPGVQSTASLADVSRIVTKALNEGNWKWFEISRNQTIINASIREAPSGLINTDCSLTPVLVFLEDHKAETLRTAVEAVETFAADNSNEVHNFKLAAGNAGVEAATNEVISKAKNLMLMFVYGVVSILCFLTFRSLRAVLCIVVPLGLTSVLCEAIMTVSGIGVKVATLPVIALGVGIGVDYGIYIYTKLEKYLLEGKALQEAYFETLRSTGKAVIFTGVTLGLGVVTWIFSPIKFQADMGLLLFFMFIWNMVGSIWLLPALARFLLRPDQMVAKARAASK